MTAIERFLETIKENATYMGAGRRKDAIFGAVEGLERHLATRIATEQEIQERERRAASRAADYAYGGTHRHPLDMD